MSTEALHAGTTFAAVLGRVLAYYREHNGLEQSDIAKKLNLGQSAWSRIERGETVINVEQLQAVAEALGTSASVLLREAEKAAEGLRERNVKIASTKSVRSGNDALAFIGLATLATLVISSLGKR